MFGEGAVFGFTPITELGLRAGHLYNVVIGLLIVLACWAAYRGVRPRTFSFFLLALGNYWLLTAAANLTGWSGLLGRAAFFGPLWKFSLALPAVVLLYYLLRQTLANRAAARTIGGLFGLVGAAYFVVAAVLDGNVFTQNYWGVAWRQSFWPLTLYVQGLLLPIILLAAWLVLRTTVSALREQKKIDLTLYWGAIIYALLENARVTAGAVGWPDLLASLLYILVAFGAYTFYAGGKSAVPGAQRRRWPVMAKLLGLFGLLSLLPIIALSALTFISFKEIIDLYIYQPLLWNLKTSREAFLAALTDVQLQALVLTSLTLLLVVLAAVIVSRGVAGSLKKLAVAMGKVARGDFSFDLAPDSNDELGDVVNYFNAMAAEVRRSREVMERWNRELEIKIAERTQDLRVLYNVSRAIGSSLDLELLVDRALEQLLPVVKSDRYALLNTDGTIRFARGFDQAGVGKLRLNAAADQPYRPAGALAAPLRAKGQPLGCLLIGAPAEQAAADRAVGLLATVADQLAVALENVGVYEKEKEAVARLTELDRLKNEFISMVSHELRTPVTSVEGYVSLLQAGAVGPVSDEQKKCLAVVQENDQRLLTLIDRLLDFSRIESGRFQVKRELLSLHQVVEQAAGQLAPQRAKRGAEFKLKLKAHDDRVMGDRERLAEVLVNLLENALKFAREGEPARITVSSAADGNYIRLTVADNGLGLGAEHLEKIFNKFFQVEETMTRKVGGVGLGLALVKEIVSNHQGRVWAESDGPGKGTRIVLTLPVAEKV